MERIVCWFSCGAASAVAAKLAISQFKDRNVVVARNEIVEEHPDNWRFHHDCERWFGVPITVLRNEKFGASIYQVFAKERFLVGPKGAPCTRALKRQVRMMFEEEDDIQVFGFTCEEQDRADEYVKRNSYVKAYFPLIERGLSKSDCLAMIADAGIEIPAMYRLGYRNNNCIGCVKGGIGYWNKIRRDFPDSFNRMAQMERDIGRAILKDTKGPIYLDELDPGRGLSQEEPDIQCSIFCHMAKEEYE